MKKININSLFMAVTMDLASDLQDRYNHLRAAHTQNVRNPLPMHALVKLALPTLPKPASIVKAMVRTKFTVEGKQFIKSDIKNMFATDALPVNFWKTKSPTAREVYATLKSKGFFVTPHAVAVALGTTANVQSIRDTVLLEKQDGSKKSKSICRYFVASN